MVRRYKDEVNAGRKRNALALGAQGNRKGGGGIRKETALDESRKDTPDRVARYHTD